MLTTDTSVINIAGREFKIPCLPFKKNRTVVPACSFALKAINENAPPASVPLNVTAIDYIYLAVFEAVSHADPKVTREEFDSWGCYLPDMISAVMTIALQTGVLVRVSTKEGGGQGEAGARKI